MKNLKEVLKKHGFNFKKCFGQNFLSDELLLGDIATDADISENDTVIEIGCGGGTLTRELAIRAKRVISFEIDLKLKPILDEMLEEYKNVELVFKDILRMDMNELEDMVGGKYKVVANLPYYITTPIIMKFLEEAKNLQCLVIMVQKEVALRLVSKEAKSDYGSITIAIDSRADSKITRHVDRSKFTPSPNVDSAVVKIVINENKFQIDSKEMFRKVVRIAFLNRRKMLVNNLMSGFSFSREEAEKKLIEIGVDLKIRGEALNTETFVRLANLLNKN